MLAGDSAAFLLSYLQVVFYTINCIYNAVNGINERWVWQEEEVSKGFEQPGIRPITSHHRTMQVKEEDSLTRCYISGGSFMSFLYKFMKQAVLGLRIHFKLMVS